jgi:oligopeptide transport system substrate-binding protein
MNKKFYVILFAVIALAMVFSACQPAAPVVEDAVEVVEEVEEEAAEEPAGIVRGGIQWVNPEYEELVVQAGRESDNAKRQDLYAAASEILVVEDAVVAPIYWYTRNTLTKPYVTRTFSTGGHEHYEKWDVEDAAKILYVTTGGSGDIPTLDPSLSSDTTSIQFAIEMFPGITRPDEVTNVVLPGMATGWEISDDGLVYTFSLRDDIYWVKYDPVLEEVVQVLDDEGEPRVVTADDFAYGFLRTLKPETASPYAYVLGFVMEGANAYNAGEVEDPETVGVKVVDASTLELTFIEPAAYNAAIAGMWMGYAQPSWLIAEVGDRWIETGLIQGYGPFVLKEWIHDYEATLIKNPFWLGTDEMPIPNLEEVNFRFLDAPESLVEYEAGSMDVTAVPLEDMDRVKADAVLSEQLVTAADFCVYYYGFNTTKPPVDDARVRRALSYAIDRVSLVENVTKGGQVPAQWIENPGLAGAPTLESHPDAGIKFDPDMAVATLQEYLDETGQTADALDITLQFNTSAGHQAIAEAIQTMWMEHLGVNVKLTNQEWAVHLDSVDSNDAPQIFRLGWCLDYADANSFTKDVFAEGGNSNPVISK